MAVEDMEDISPEILEADLRAYQAEMSEEEQSEKILEHYDNLVPMLEESSLLDISQKVIEGYTADLSSRSEWETTIEKGLGLLGVKLELEQTEPFEGACGAFHPLIIENAVKFQSKASMEMFPPSGPVKTRIWGDLTDQVQAQGERVKEHMNYQLTEEMEEYFDDFERMLLYLSIVGSTFRKVYYDPVLKRPVSEYIPADQFVISSMASDLVKADRYTHVIYRTDVDYISDVEAGLYVDTELLTPSSLEKSSIATKIDQLLGQGQPDSSVSPVYTFLEQTRYLQIDEMQDKRPYPYVVTIDKDSRKVLSIRRCWKEEDSSKRKLENFVHYKFIPSFGFYGFGYLHLLGNMQATLTSIVRSLVNAGYMSTMPPILLGRGIRYKQKQKQLSYGEIRDVDVTGQDLQKSIFVVPSKEPSTVLYTLLEFLESRGQKFADTTEAIVGDAQSYGPVGTILALLDASTKFFSSLHKRLHNSFKRELAILARINYECLPNEYPFEVEGGNRKVLKSDYDGRVDVTPVSDPNISSNAHRLAIAQTQLSMAAQAPQIHDLREAYKRVYQAMNVKHIDKILPPPQEAQPLDPMGDLLAVQQGKPIKAFPGQDHDAHISFKSSFLQDPTGGGSPFMQSMIPIIQANVQEHILIKFQEQIGAATSGAATDPNTQAQVEAQAMQKISQANQIIATYNEQGGDPAMVLAKAELKKAEVQEKKVQQEGIKSAADLTLKKEELDLKQRQQDIDIAQEEVKLITDVKKERLKLNAKLAEKALDRLLNGPKNNPKPKS